MKIALVVPAYQAEATLEATLGRIPPQDRSSIASLTVIDDGCTDATAAVALRIGAYFDGFRLLRNGRNLGYGRTVQRGLVLAREEDADVAAILHADGQYPPERVVEFARLCLDRDLALLQGSRHRAGTARQGGMPLYKIFFGKALVALENQVFGLSLSDYHSGYLFHHRRALRSIPYERLGTSFDFDLQCIACARARQLPVGEEAIATRYAGEVSHLNPLTYGLRVLKVLAKYRLGHFGRRMGPRSAPDREPTYRGRESNSQPLSPKRMSRSTNSQTTTLAWSNSFAFWWSLRRTTVLAPPSLTTDDKGCPIFRATWAMMPAALGSSVW